MDHFNVIEIDKWESLKSMLDSVSNAGKYEVLDRISIPSTRLTVLNSLCLCMPNQKCLDPFTGLCTAVSWPALGEWEFPFCGHMDLPKVGKSSLTLGPIRGVSLPMQHMRQNWPWSKPNGPDILNPYENFKPYAHRVGRCLHRDMSRCRFQSRLVYSNVRVNGHTLFYTA